MTVRTSYSPTDFTCETCGSVVTLKVRRTTTAQSPAGFVKPGDRLYECARDESHAVGPLEVGPDGL